MPGSRRRRLLALAAVSALAALAPAGAASPAGATSAVSLHPSLPTPVLGRVVIGYSVQHRPLVAYHLGDPTARRKTLVVGEMHGDEHAGVVVANSIIHGSRSVEGIDLWVIPTMNPDGDAAHTRQNAHGVDLNRNWPNNWAPLTGEYYSGPRPLSEPETQAVARFIRTEHPRYVVSLHQPLQGVDKTAGSGPAYRAFRDALSRNLGLPVKDFQCWSVCHGSMSGWYQTHHLGVAVETVEFGWTPAHDYLVGRVRRGIIAALGGHWGPLAAHNPYLRASITPGAGQVQVRGAARDRDDPAVQLRYHVLQDGTQIAHGLARAAQLDGHGIARTLQVTPGRHRFCVQADNIGAGTRNPMLCSTVTVTS